MNNGSPNPVCKRKINNKKTKGLQGTLKRGLVGARRVEVKLSREKLACSAACEEEWACVYTSQAAAVVGRGPPRALHYPASTNGPRSLTPGSSLLIWHHLGGFPCFSLMPSTLLNESSSLGTPRGSTTQHPLVV